MRPPVVTPLDERVYHILAEARFPADLFNPRQYLSCELVEHYVLGLATRLTADLGLPAALAVPRTVAEVLTRSGLAADFDHPVRWLLERLAAAEVISREEAAGGVRYRLIAPLPAFNPSIAKDETLAIDPGYGPTFALLDYSAAAYLRVARGEVTGEQALFRNVALWCAYFSNDNPYYALNNHMAAQAAEARLPAIGGRVLEVGAGLGSATDALLARVRAAGRLSALSTYTVTEPVLFFRRRAQRALEANYPAAPLRFAGLDLNLDWEVQGIRPASVDLVWAVNVFHLARDLERSLRRAFSALTPGGWLVLGEGIRPFPGQVLGAEFPFQLLKSFVDVQTDPATRPTHGFLTPEQWLAPLARAGFAPVELVPDLIRVRELFRGFFGGVVCGRRPLTS